MSKSFQTINGYDITLSVLFRPYEIQHKIAESWSTIPGAWYGTQEEAQREADKLSKLPVYGHCRVADRRLEDH